MKTHFKTLFVVFFLLSISIHCQVTNSQEFLNSRNITSIDLRSTEVKGDAYLNTDFMPARLSLDNTIYSMRFNAYQDEMEVEKDDKLYDLKKQPGYQITFLTTNKVYAIYNFDQANQVKTGFFVVLFQGDKVSLLLKEKIEFFEEVKPKTGYDKYQPPKLERVDDKFYMSRDGVTAIELPRRKKEILSLFLEKAGDVESYAKKNKLSFNKNEELAKIFAYYNSL